MSSSKIIAKILAKDDFNNRLYIQFQNGQVATVDDENQEVFKIGSIVLIDNNFTQVELAPNELWPEESWVGIVRLKLDDITVVDCNGHWKKIKTNNSMNYDEGNTVEGKDSSGIFRILSKNPIKYIDLPTIDETVVSKFKIPKNRKIETFEDFGGYVEVVERAKELIELPLKHKTNLSKINARPIRGVLFTGEPGTGKTMLARIIANNTDAEFYEIRGPEIFSKWYGQSPEILRKLFEDAAEKERAIIFFDELDSIAGQRDNNSHEESRRVVAQLLTLMDGFTADKNIIVIASSNRPQDIDPALRRPGRFDWEIYFPIPNRTNRELILKASARLIKTERSLPHNWVAQNTEGWTAAELAAIWSEASLLAAADDRDLIMTEDFVGGFERVLNQRRLTKQTVSSGVQK